jgi:hypothetical protein
VAGAGFFDDPMGGSRRTVGTYLRLDTAPQGSPRALVDAVAEVSRDLGARFEVQVSEQVLGVLDDGQPDAALRGALDEL